MASALLRLFIAIELPESAARYIGDAIVRLRQQELPGIRWVRPEGVHLTLKFLGNTPEGRVQPIVAAMRKAAAGVAPFALQLQAVGAFPHLRAPRVLWVSAGHRPDPPHASVTQQESPETAGAEPALMLPKGPAMLEPLTQLQEWLEEALKAQGFARDRRAFSPHLTLGRINGRLSHLELERLTQAIDKIRELEPAALPVTELSLMESQLSREGAVYRRKAQIPLK